MIIKNQTKTNISATKASPYSNKFKESELTVNLYKGNSQRKLGLSKEYGGHGSTRNLNNSSQK